MTADPDGLEFIRKKAKINEVRSSLSASMPWGGVQSSCTSSFSSHKLTPKQRVEFKGIEFISVRAVCVIEVSGLKLWIVEVSELKLWIVEVSGLKLVD